MKLEQPRLPVTEVLGEPEFTELISALSKSKQIGLDAERASGFRYSNKAYLIQIATAERIYLVDPISPDMPSDWQAQLSSAMKPITWILHSATQDLPCLAELGITPTKIIDTELAARFLGVERFGLASLAETFLELELAKEHSAADWSVRPLDDGMLTYAALDVDILFELWAALEQNLSKDEKFKWLDEEFGRLVEFRPKPALAEPWRGLPGMSKVKDLKRQQIAASLWHARDRLARESDVAPGRLIPDRSIAAVVASPPKSKGELARNRDFQGRASRSKLDVWWQAIESAAEIEIAEPVLASDHVPNHRSWEKRFPEAHQRLNAVRPLLVEKATELNLAIELVLTPDILRRVCFQPAEDLAAQLAGLGARSWQIELCAPLIRAGLELAAHQPLPEA